MDKAKDGMWTYSYDEELWYNGEYFDTKEEAIEHGKNDTEEQERFEETYEDKPDKFYVGMMVLPSPHINADILLDNISESYCDQCGEYAEDWYRGIKNEDIVKLDTLISGVFSKWQKETNNIPTFFTVTKVKEIEL